MATRKRECVPGREKRGTSPSYAPQIGGTPHQRRSPNTSKTSSPTKNRDSTTTPTKSVPNYLKPTISSGNDVSKQQGKKQVSSPSLIRRRSFDKPLSPSHTPKRVSPIPTLRSSSFSGKTLTSQKVGPDKNLKGLRDSGKQHSMFGASKKSSMYVKKQGSESSASITKEEVTNTSAENHNKSNVPEPETEAEDTKSIVTEAEEQTGQDESNYENNIEVPVPEDQEIKTTIEQSEIETSLSVNSEEPEEKLHNDEKECQEQELKHAMNDAHINATKENVAVNPTEEVEEKELEESIVLEKKEDEGSGNEKEIEAQEVAGAEKVSENAEVEETHEIENEAPEEKETENAPMEEKHEIDNAPMDEKKETEKVAQKQQVAHGKKDAALSNDVIEETASKLREQRKNKVRALAGAFETVISLQ